MPLDQITRLRQLIGERIPSGGSASDTMFTDAEVQDFLTRGNNSLYQAAAVGWQVKAATYADLASTTEGNASRLSSDLHDHALRQVRYYESFFSDVVGMHSRTRIGKISRPGTGSV